MPGKFREVVFLAVRPELAARQTRGERKRAACGGKEAGGLGRTADGAKDASPRGRLRGAPAPAPAGRMEEGRRGGEVRARRRGGRRSDPAVPTHPALGTLPARGPGVRSACADSPRRKSRCLTPGERRNPATLHEKRFPPCNTPRERKMSGDDGGGRVTYPCSFRG